MTRKKSNVKAEQVMESLLVTTLMALGIKL